MLAHPLRPQTTPLARQIADSLARRGVDVWVRTGEEAEEPDSLIAGTDLVVAIGGDGAMLRAARICAPAGVPVLGVNVGRLGFLTEVVDPQGWPTALERLLAGDGWIEERMMLNYTARRGEGVLARGDALNEVVIGRGPVPVVVWLETYIDGGWTTTYIADALIVATATGSTAYALAVGGPILPPELKNILVVPVAPHLSMDRPIVVSQGAVIEVVISPETRTETALTADGGLAAVMLAGDRVVVQASGYTSRFVRLRERTYFYRSLLDRLEPRHPSRQSPNRESGGHRPAERSVSAESESDG